MPEATGRGPGIVVLAPNWLGDVVMATPLISRLAAARDAAGRGARVTLAVRAAWAPLFADDPRLAGVLPVDRPGRHAGPLGIMRLAADLRALAAEAIVLGPPSLRAGLVARLAGIPRRIGHRGDGRTFLLSRALPRPPRGRQHHSTELLALAEPLLAELGLLPEPGREAGWSALPAWGPAGAAATGDGPAVWVFAPGTTYGDAKVWPMANATEFARRVVGDRGVRLALVGDDSAAAFAGELCRAAGVPWRRDLAGPAALVDLTGRTGIGDLAALLLAAAAFVGNDSGVMHLAGALGVPTVGLFGSTDPAWTAPLGPRTRVLAADGFACRPCFRRTCNQERFCLATIAADVVEEAVAALVATKGKAPA